MITARDDLRHQPTTEENYSESKWFSFCDASGDFWMSARIGLEPNRNRANRWIVMALDGTVLRHDLATDLPLPAQEWDRIELAGLEFVTLDPMSRYGIRCRWDDLELELAWEARTPIFDYRDCPAPLPPSLAAMHYEQSGEVNGTLTMRKDSRTLQGTGHRDHSWGVRHWEGFRAWTAIMGRLDDRYFHLEQFHEETTGLTTHGWVSVAGRNVPLKNATLTPAFDGTGSFPGQFGVAMEDALGGTLEMAVSLRNTCPLDFGKCRVGESFGLFSRESEAVPGIVEFGRTR